MEEPIQCITHFGDFVWIGLYRSIFVFDCNDTDKARKHDVNIAYDITPCQGKIWVACNDKIRVWDAKVNNNEKLIL